MKKIIIAIIKSFRQVHIHLIPLVCTHSLNYLIVHLQHLLLTFILNNIKKIKKMITKWTPLNSPNWTFKFV